MKNDSAASKYKTNAILTASREEIVSMLYDGALGNLKKAKNFLKENRLADFGIALGRTHSIVSELMNSLDHEVGERLSRNLESLYSYILERITQANLKRESESIDVAIKLLSTLKEGWDAAVTQI